MSLPYHWHPMGARNLYGQLPKVGQYLAFEHEVYRIIEIREKPADLWTDADRKAVSSFGRVSPCNIVVRKAGKGDDVKDRNGDLHLRYGGQIRGDLYVYDDEHYPTCARCREPLPCREQMIQRTVSESAKKDARYSIAGVCPACAEPVTSRQQSLTWADNVHVPLGPPVTYHLRRRCRYSAVRYEKLWAAADPENRKTRLSCTGHVQNHGDGTYSCTQLGECPGVTAAHPSYSICNCPEHPGYDSSAFVGKGCYPPAGARRVEP